MKIHKVTQGNLDWLRLHIGIPTASALGNLVDSSFELRKGKMPKTYIYTKVAEAWRGQPLVSLGSNGSFSTEQGMILEEEALPFFQLMTGHKVDRVGFITTDDGRFGCSPDGIITSHIDRTQQIGLELKCPAAHTHVEYLLGGVVPAEYVTQVYASMSVTGFKKWIFMSYRRGFPPLVLTVNWDDSIHAKIQTAVDEFHKAFDASKKRIAELDTAATK